MFIIDAALGLAGKITDAVSGYFKSESDKVIAKLEIEKHLIDFARQVDVGQIELNKVELGKEGWFFGGWRPAIGWMGALAIGYEFLIRPVYNATSYLIWPVSPELPAADLETIIGIVTAMLGVAGLRTVEKLKGVHRD